MSIRSHDPHAAARTVIETGDTRHSFRVCTCARHHP